MRRWEGDNLLSRRMDERDSDTRCDGKTCFPTDWYAPLHWVCLLVTWWCSGRVRVC